MVIKKIIVGSIQTNCYLIVSGDELTIVDPGDEAEKIASEIEKISTCHSRVGGNPDQIFPKYILLTHGHFDHVMSVNELKKKYGFKLVIGERDKNFSKINQEIGINVPNIKADITVKEKKELEFGEKKILVFKSPGHSKGSVCYLFGENLFSGDTLFYHSHGRTDLPGGSDEEIKKSLENLFKLDEKIKVFPGHGPETTIKKEKEYYGKGL